MENQLLPDEEKVKFQFMLDSLIRIVILVGLVTWCFMIMKPFLMIILWGLVLAVALKPFYNWVTKLVSGRKKIAASIVTFLMLAVILAPVILLGDTLYTGVMSMKAIVDAGGFTISPPSKSVESWPVIGHFVYDSWMQASHNVGDLISKYSEQFKTGLIWIIGAVQSASVGVVLFLVSIIVSGFFLAISEPASAFSHDFANRVAGDRGSDFIRSAEGTIRSVARGIIGVSLIQSVLLGIGFLVAGVPGAGMWTMLCLFLGIIQIGPFPVVLGVLGYMYMYAELPYAIGLTIWSILIGPIDNILKPIMLGRGSQSPMIVIFLGSIGGFIMSGIIGLFVGAVILSLGYDLFIIWMGKENSEKTPDTEI